MPPAPEPRFLAVLRPVLANGAIRRVELAWLLSVAAEWAYLVALLIYAYTAGGVLAVGLVTTLRLLPAALLSPLIGHLGDRLPRGRVLVGARLGRAAAIGVAAVAVAAGLPPAVPVAAAAIEGMLAPLHRSTMLALLPSLARSPGELVASNALTSVGEAAGVLVGPALGGVLLAVGGPVFGMAVAAIAFVGGAILVLSVHVASTAAAGALPEHGHGGLAAVLGGFRALVHYPSAGTLVGLFGGQTFVRGALTVLVVVASVELLGLGDQGVGWLNSAIGAGGVVGGGVALTLVVGRRLSLPFVIALALWGLPIALIGLMPHPALAFVFLGVLGGANALLDVAGFTLLQRSVPNAVRGRVFGALESVAALSTGAGAMVTPLLVEWLGIIGALLAVGALLPILAVLSTPAVRHADAAAVVPHRELDLLRGIAMFAPLSMTTLEQLAASLVPMRAAAGEAIVRQGEPGADYFVIAAGTAEVHRDGRRLATLGPGDGFGEIALLSDVPRTASVVASDAMEGYSLPRAAFLEAVTGSPHSAAVAGRLVAGRLSTL